MPTNKKIPPTHPGEVLLEDIMKPLGLSANKIAMAMRVPLSRVTEPAAGSAPWRLPR